MVANVSKKIVSLCKRRGFIFPSSEIYGGFASTYDYGPLGAQMFRNIKNSWWSHFVEKKVDVFGIEGSIFCHPKTWEASGHVGSFNDPLVEDKVTHKRYRADHLLEENLGIETATLSFEEMADLMKKHDVKSPEGNELTELKSFNLLVEAELGSTAQNKEKVYLRGETCQIIFLQYLNVLNSMRAKIPFGIAQVGRSFRNEITTKDFVYRTREFTQMELEYFIHPDEGDKWFEYWKEEMLDWASGGLGLPRDSFRYRDIPDEEKSHYAKIQKDFEFKSSSGKWFELSPLNHRGEWDLGGHQKHSGQSFVYRDPYSSEEFLPHVIEISLGLDRILYSLLDNAYTEVENRVVLKLDKRIAPYRAAVFPLLKNKPKLVSGAKDIFNSLIEKGYSIAWDDRGNIGKRYLSQDEIGTPSCITVDFQTLDDDTVTIRDRDSTVQIRVNVADIENSLR